MSNDEAWKNFCIWAVHPHRYDGTDIDEPWDVKTTKPKKKQRRKVTLSRAMRAAKGLAVSGATITTEGVKLEFDDGAVNGQHNPWDDVQ